MPNEYSEAAYRILGCSWDLSAPGTRRSFAELLNSAEGGAKNFCDLYFDRFLLVHEVGHIVRDLCAGGAPPAGAEEEYLANLFALKYFQFKKCDKYLADLFRWLDFLLETYQVKIKFDLAAMNALFDKYRQDRRTYGALQFMCIKEALKDTASLQNVVERISGGKIGSIDTGVILRKDIAGSELVAECVHVVFGLSDIRPAVELRPVPELGVQTRELLRG